jgi:hypothetical protein
MIWLTFEAETPVVGNNGTGNIACRFNSHLGEHELSQEMIEANNK